MKHNTITVFNPQNNNSLGDLMVIKSIDDYMFCGYEANKTVVWKKDHNIVSPELFSWTGTFDNLRCGL